jgi:hypothetical protein
MWYNLDETLRIIKTAGFPISTWMSHRPWSETLRRGDVSCAISTWISSLHLIGWAADQHQGPATASVGDRSARVSPVYSSLTNRDWSAEAKTSSVSRAGTERGRAERCFRPAPSAKSYSSPRCANISRAGFGSPGLGSFGAFFLPFFLFRWFFPDSVGFFLFYFQYFWIWANFAYILYLFNFFCSDSKFV